MSRGPVVPLGRTPPPEPEPTHSRPRRLHGIAILLMALSVSVALILSLAYVTVTWSGAPRRVVIAAMLGSILMFFIAVSISILTAARDTYIEPGPAPEQEVEKGP